MTQLDTIPVDQINVGEDFNPRSEIILDDGFLASIETHGILTPILVHPQGSGKHTRYFLVAGQRRYQAALQLGHKEIPAVIRTEFPAGHALPTALVENMQRQQLTPLEEARAFKRAHDDGLTGKQIAEAVGVSLDTIRQRLQLLDLPEKVQDLVDTGDVTLKTAGELQRLAPFGDQVVAKTAELLAAGQDSSSWDEPIVPGDITQNPEWVLDRVLSELEDDAPFLTKIRKGGRPHIDGYGAIEFPDGVDVAPLKSKLAQLPQYGYGPDYKPVRAVALEITQEDLDAARAYGCLLEIGDVTYLNDPAWLLDLLDGKADKAVASWDRKQKRAAKKTSDAATDPAGAEKEAKRQERAEQRAAQLSARERNVSLRHALMELYAPEVTLDAIRAVGELLLEYAADDLGHAWRFVDERAETVTRKKNGEISSLAYDRAAGGLIVDAFRRAETTEHALGVLVAALVAARFADRDAARQSDRYMHIRGLGSYQPSRPLVDAIEKIADPILPPDIRLELKERKEREAVERDRYAAELRGDLEKSDFPGRVRAGTETCPSCGNAADLGNDGFEPCSCTDEQMIAAVVSCPACGETECFATCTGFQPVAEIDEPAEGAAA